MTSDHLCAAIFCAGAIWMMEFVWRIAREGLPKRSKGGVNDPPKIQRPPPPKGQGGHEAATIHRDPFTGNYYIEFPDGSTHPCSPSGKVGLPPGTVINPYGPGPFAEVTLPPAKPGAGDAAPH